MVIAVTLLTLANQTASRFDLSTAGLVAGDAVGLIVHNGQDKSGSIAPDETGWLEPFAPLRGWGGDITLSNWFRTLTAAPPATYGVAWSGSISSIGALLRITGHDPADLIDVAGTQTQSSSTPNSPGVTTTQDDTAIIATLSHQRPAAVEDDGPPGFTTEYFRNTGSWLGAGGSAHALQALAGPSAAAVWTMAQGGSYGSASVAINSGAAPPAAGVGPLVNRGTRLGSLTGEVLAA